MYGLQERRPKHSTPKNRQLTAEIYCPAARIQLFCRNVRSAVLMMNGTKLIPPRATTANRTKCKYGVLASAPAIGKVPRQNRASPAMIPTRRNHIGQTAREGKRQHHDQGGRQHHVPGIEGRLTLHQLSEDRQRKRFKISHTNVKAMIAREIAVRKRETSISASPRACHSTKPMPQASAIKEYTVV